MFSRNKDKTLAPLSESQLLLLIRQWLGPSCPASPFGIGDDAAVLPPAGKSPTLLTNDAVVLNQHFTTRDAPQTVGKKLLCRNLSDIAAMGGSPQYAIIQLICPRNLSLEWLRQFYQGIAATAQAYSVQIVGGDCTTAPNRTFAASLTITGTAPRPLTRNGSQPGDHIMVTGELGGSILGHHLNFNPRLDAGRWLASQPEVAAMIDITDGIAKDLPALLPPNSCAALNLEAIPISPAAYSLARQSDKTPLHHALCDGEDYELLFTVRTQSPDDFIARWQQNPNFPILSHIGSITASHSPNTYPITDSQGQPLTAVSGFEAYQPTL